MAEFHNTHSASPRRKGCRRRRLANARDTKTFILRQRRGINRKGRGRGKTPACPPITSKPVERRGDTSLRSRLMANPVRKYRSRTSTRRGRSKTTQRRRKIAIPIRRRRSQMQEESFPVNSRIMEEQERSSKSSHSLSSTEQSRDSEVKSERDEESKDDCSPVEMTVSESCQERECEREEPSFPYRLRLRANRTPQTPRDKDRRGGARSGDSLHRRSNIKLKCGKNKQTEVDSDKDSLSQSRSQSERSGTRPMYRLRTRPRDVNTQPGPSRAEAPTRGRGRRGKLVEIKAQCQSSTSSSSPMGGRGGDVNSSGRESLEGCFKLKQSRRKRAWESSEEVSEDELVETQMTAWSRGIGNRGTVTSSLGRPIVVHHMTRRRKALCLQNQLLEPSNFKVTTAPSKSSMFYFGPNPSSFKSLYSLGSILGKGGCGAVYAAIRKCDGKQVAIKYVSKGMAEPYVKLPGKGPALPLEVALMQIVSRPPACSFVLQLLEWFEEAERFVLVLERPYPCMDLFDFMEELGGRVDECLARAIMLQVVLALRHCRDRGVLHRDVKAENLLVHTDNLRVKLIDFGCGDLLRDASYRDYSGTEEFCPPEWVLSGTYQGRHATIWSLGVLLFNMVCGHLPFNKDADIIAGRPRFRKYLSRQCRALIRWCLQRDPSKRPVLEQILLHDWMVE